eukprot:3164554-Pyramimonas_sp.AAC.1
MALVKETERHGESNRVHACKARPDHPPHGHVVGARVCAKHVHREASLVRLGFGGSLFPVWAAH